MRAFRLGRKLACAVDLAPPADLRPLLDWLALETVRWRFRGRLREIIVDGVIGLDDRLSDEWARWLVGHAIGHHLLHPGTSFYLDSWQWVNRVKVERQAEEFAAGLFMPRQRLHGTGPLAAARRLGLPDTKVTFAWPLWADYGE